MYKVFATLTIGLVVAAFAAGDAAAQDGGARNVTLRVGGLMYDRGGDATNLMVGLGIDWALSRHLLAEVESTWSASDDVYFSFQDGSQFPAMRETSTHLATATAGVQAQALLGRVRPYIGLSGGLFLRYDEHGSGDRFFNTTMAIPAGVRVDLTDRIGLRGELRARFDTHQDGGSGINIEQTLGLGFRF